jgi:hypothetical protein
MLEFEEEILEAAIPKVKPGTLTSLRNFLPTVDLFFWVKACVFIDFLGVAFVIPLLSSYLRDAGVNAEVYGLMSSSYYFSQIVGSLAMGVLLDSLSRRNMLILSFIGSAISYAIVGLSKELWLLFASRVVVGLVKQTYTISTSILTSTCSDHSRRAELMGHLSAATTLAFIIGPTLGSMLYAVDPRLPAVVASCLFLVNIVICYVTIPDIIPSHEPQSPSGNPNSASRLGILTYLDGAILPVIALVIIAFVERSMANTNIMSYFELRYELPTASLGYVSSVSSLVTLLAQLFLIKPVLSLCGGNEQAALLCALIACAVANFIEGNCITIYHYLIFFVPISVTGSSILHTLSRSVLSGLVPSEHIGKALGALGLLESGVGVLAPMYSAEIFSWSGHHGRGAVAAVHYLTAAVIVWALLRGSHFFAHETHAVELQKKGDLIVPDDAGASGESKTTGNGVVAACRSNSSSNEVNESEKELKTCSGDKGSDRGRTVRNRRVKKTRVEE